MAFNPYPAGWFTPTGSPGGLSWGATSALSPQAALAQAGQQTYSTQGSGGNGPGGTYSQQDWDRAIEIMTRAWEASAGLDRDRLAAEIRNAELARENALEIARLQAETSRYGIDAQRQTAIEQRIEQARQFDTTHLETIRQFDKTFAEQGRQFDLELQEKQATRAQQESQFGRTLDEQIAARLQEAANFRDQLEYQYGRAYADDWFRNEQLKLSQEAHNLNQAQLGMQYAQTYAQLASNSADPWALADWQAGLAQTSAGQDIPVYMQRLQQGITTPAFQAPAAGGGPGTMSMDGLMAANGVPMAQPTGSAPVGSTGMPQFAYAPSAGYAEPGRMPAPGPRVPTQPTQPGQGVGVPEGPVPAGQELQYRAHVAGAPVNETRVAPAAGRPLVNAAMNAMTVGRTTEGPVGPPPGMTYHQGQLVPAAPTAVQAQRPAAPPPGYTYHEGRLVPQGGYHEGRPNTYTPQQNAILQHARTMLQEGGHRQAPQAYESLNPLAQKQLASTLDRAGGAGAFENWDWQRRQGKVGQSIGGR